MITLAEVLDAWATSQPKPFVIIYGPHRQPPYRLYTPTISWIECQWCGQQLGEIRKDHISFYWCRDPYLKPTDPDFFEKLSSFIHKVHRCIDDTYIR